MRNHQHRDLNPVSIITGNGDGCAHRLAGTMLQRNGTTPLDAARIAEFNSKEGGLERALKVGAVDKEARTVELAFSSEYEGKRWFGIEILDHTPTSVRLDRIRDSGSLLVNHDEDDQVGVVTAASIDADRKGRATVRFGNSARAQEIFQDILDGIRKHVSVRYRVHAATLQEIREGGDVEVIRVTDWEPYEISIVPVPFDHTVGVNRSAEKPHEEKPVKKPENSPITENRQLQTDPKGHLNMKTKILRNAAGDLVRAEVDESGAITKELEVLEAASDAVRTALNSGSAAERQRSATILELGDKFAMVELARSFVKDGKSVEDFSRAAGEAFEKRVSRPLGEQTRDANVGLSEDEVNKYSFINVVRALMPNATRADKEAAAFEFECSRAAEKMYGREARGALVPSDVLAGRAFNTGGAPNSPAGAQTGAFLVDNKTLFNSFIDTLRNKTTAMRLATVMGGLVGNVDIPKKTANGTAYWLGEGQDAQETGMALGQISFSPKTLAAYTEATRRLLMQSTPDAERLMRMDLMDAVGQAIDQAFYYGSGSEYQPRGLKYYTGINAQVFASGLAPTFPELVGMETAIATDNADVNSMAYVANAKFRGHAKTTAKFGTGTESTIWEQGNSVNGYRTEITNQIADGEVFFGNFADAIIALWGGLDVTVDPYSLSKSGGTRIVVFQDVDMNLRRLESFCLGKAA